MKDETKILVALCVAGFLSTLIWFNYSAVLPIVSEEWGLDGRMNGRLIGFFHAGYVIAVILTGILSDRIGGKKTFIICALQTGTCGVGFALFAHDFISGLIWRTLAGLGQGGLYVPGMKILSRCYQSNERGKALGIYTSVLVASYAATYYVAGPVAAKYSWRLAVFLTSVTAFPGALLVLFLVNEKPANSNDSEHKRAPADTRWRKDLRLMRAILFSKPWLLVAGGYMGHMWEMYAMYGWIGAYLTACAKTLGMPTAEALSLGSTVSATCILMGAFSPAIGGLLSDRFGRGRIILVFLAISISCSLAYGWLYGFPLIVLGIVGIVYGFAGIADSPIYKAAVADFIPEEALGTALGMQSFLGFGMSIVSPCIFGSVLDSHGWRWAWVSVGIGAFIGPISIVLFQLLPKATRQGYSKFLSGCLTSGAAGRIPREKG